MFLKTMFGDFFSKIISHMKREISNDNSPKLDFLENINELNFELNEIGKPNKRTLQYYLLTLCEEEIILEQISNETCFKINQFRELLKYLKYYNTNNNFITHISNHDGFYQIKQNLIQLIDLLDLVLDMLNTIERRLSEKNQNLDIKNILIPACFEKIEKTTKYFNALQSLIEEGQNIEPRIDKIVNKK